MNSLIDQLNHKHQLNIKRLKSRNLGGGCINETLLLETDQGKFCIKLNHVSKADMFQKEWMGLALLAKHSSFVVPQVIGTGSFQSKSYLLMTYEPPGQMCNDYWEKMGKNLAKLHSTKNEMFGLDHHNYIGELPQDNTPGDNWLKFFFENRIINQINLALENKLVDEKFRDEFTRLIPIFQDMFPEESPALIHGDLWNGNVGIASNGDPFIFDPAVYFANREMEIAFTCLFGGFDPLFYKSYQYHLPMAPGFNDRIDLYNLYPLLVHLNLFGASYKRSIDQILMRFSAHLS